MAWPQATAGSLFFKSLTLVQVFTGIAGVAYFFMHVQQKPVGLRAAFEHHCPADGGAVIGIGAYRAYTGNHSIDFVACMLVNVFSGLLNAPLRTASIPFILALPGAWFAVILDAAALFPNKTFLAISVPVLFGVVVQLIGGGVGLPIYWLFSLLARQKLHAERRAPPHPLKATVVGALLGTFIGAVIPTVLMVGWPTHSSITFWQPFPFYVAVIQTLVVLAYKVAGATAELSPVERYLPDEDIYRITQLGYVATGALAAVGHFYFLQDVLAAKDRLAVLSDALLPYPYIYQYSSFDELLALGPANEVKRFFQWDVLFILASSWLGGAWPLASEGVENVVAAVLMSACGGVALGPGFFITTPYMIQAGLDENKREKLLELAWSKQKGEKSQ